MEKTTSELHALAVFTIGHFLRQDVGLCRRLVLPNQQLYILT